MALPKSVGRPHDTLAHWRRALAVAAVLASLTWVAPALADPPVLGGHYKGTTDQSLTVDGAVSGDRTLHDFTINFDVDCSDGSVRPFFVTFGGVPVSSDGSFSETDSFRSTPTAQYPFRGSIDASVSGQFTGSGYTMNGTASMDAQEDNTGVTCSSGQRSYTAQTQPYSLDDINLPPGLGTFSYKAPYFKGATTEGTSFVIPRRPGYGVVAINLFIMEHEQCLPLSLFPLCGAGDDRDFSDFASHDRDRVFIRLDYENGIGMFVANPSCDPDHTQCANAWPVGGHPDSSSGNDVIAGSPDGNGLILKLSAHQSLFLNRFGGGPAGPGIDDLIILTPRADSSHDFAMLLAGDAFPAFEAYQYPPGGGSRTIDQEGEGLGGLIRLSGVNGRLVVVPPGTDLSTFGLSRVRAAAAIRTTRRVPLGPPLGKRAGIALAQRVDRSYRSVRGLTFERRGNLFLRRTRGHVEVLGSHVRGSVPAIERLQVVLRGGRVAAYVDDVSASRGRVRGFRYVDNGKLPMLEQAGRRCGYPMPGSLLLARGFPLISLGGSRFSAPRRHRGAVMLRVAERFPNGLVGATQLTIDGHRHLAAERIGAVVMTAFRTSARAPRIPKIRQCAPGR